MKIIRSAMLATIACAAMFATTSDASAASDQRTRTWLGTDTTRRQIADIYLGTMSPSSGAVSNQVFSATYSSSPGYAPLSWVQLDFASAATGAQDAFCFIHYDVLGNGLWFYSDSGYFVGPVAPGQPTGEFRNSICAVNTQATTVTWSGTNLTLSVRVLFKQAAARNAYTRAMNTNSADSGWEQKGIFQLQPASITAPSVTPSNPTGTSVTLQTSVPDPPGFEGLVYGWSQLMIATAPDGGGNPFCLVHYDRAGNAFWAYNSADGFFHGPVTPGTVSLLLNSAACSINTASSHVFPPTGNWSVPITRNAAMSVIGQTYKIYVRNMNSVGIDTGMMEQGTWIDPYMQLAAPTLVSPSSGASNVSSPITLSWSAAAGATSYDVYFGTTSPPQYLTTTTSTNYVVTSTSAATSYYWKIVAKNAGGSSPASATWNFATSATSQGGPFNLSQNPYWPTTVGNKWVMRNPNTKEVTKITVQPSRAQFGCTPNMLGTGNTSAVGVYEVDFTKLDPANYWGQGDYLNFRWFLGMQPAGQLPAGYAGHLLAFGWQAPNYSFGLPDYVPQDNYPYFNYDYGVHASVGSGVIDLLNTDNPRKPPYELLPANGVIPPGGGFFGDQIQIDLPQKSVVGNEGVVYSVLNTDCATVTGAERHYTWQVQWSTASANTPGYSGPVLKARYIETDTSNNDVWQEDWYYAYGIGPVRIDGAYGKGVDELHPLPAMEQLLELVSYTQGTGQVETPFITLKDALVAKSDQNAATFAQWSSLFSGVTNLKAPTFAAACGNPISEGVQTSVDTFLGLLENIGQSCSPVQYAPESNGWTANYLVQEMQNYMPAPMSGTSYNQWNFGYSYDQWNYAYKQKRPPLEAPGPENRCMKSLDNVPSWEPHFVVPKRFMLLSPRQWLLFYRNEANGGCAQ